MLFKIILPLLTIVYKRQYCICGVYDTIFFQIFPGNIDNHTPRITYFDKVITAKYIRVLPATYNRYAALRMEVMTPTDLLSEEGRNLPRGTICMYRKVELIVGG